MAEIGWRGRAAFATGGAAVPAGAADARLPDWEDWLTLVLALGATLSVSAGLEQSGGLRTCRPITVVIGRRRSWPRS